MEKSCPVCEKPLPDHAGSTGRPRVYCGVVCRRLSEYAIRLINRRTESLESRLSALRMDDGFRNPAYLKQQLKTIKAEIERQEKRLRALLEGIEGR